MKNFKLAVENVSEGYVPDGLLWYLIQSTEREAVEALTIAIENAPKGVSIDTLDWLYSKLPSQRKDIPSYITVDYLKHPVVGADFVLDNESKFVGQTPMEDDGTYFSLWVIDGKRYAVAQK